MKNKFKVGDKVKVVLSGKGCGRGDIGKVVTITEIGTYLSQEGYKVAPAIGNTLLNKYAGFIGESTFELADTALYEKQKVVEALEVLIEYNRGKQEKDIVGLGWLSNKIFCDSSNGLGKGLELKEFKEKFLETEEDRKKKEIKEQMDKLQAEMSKLQDQLKEL